MVKENVYYQLSTDDIFTYDNTKSCGFAYGLTSTIGRWNGCIIYRDNLKNAIKLGLIIKLGKL